MASIINAASSGSGGLVSTADSSGVLQLQTNGTTALSIGTNGVLTLSNALPTGSGGTGLASFTSGGVVYASSTSALATGSALTFDGSKLLVSSSGEQLKLLSSGDFTTTGTGYIRWYDSGGAKGYIGYAGTASQLDLQTGTGMNLNFNAVGGTATWQISNSEQMRLTSTGLGIGTSSPGAKLAVSDGTRTAIINPRSSASGGLAIGTDIASTGYVLNLAGDLNGGGTGGGVNIAYYSSATSTWNAAFSIRNTASTYSNLLLMPDGGNLGLGVTPSASSQTTFQVGAKAVLTYLNISNGYTSVGNNWIYNSGDKYIATGTASTFSQTNGAFYWYTAPSGTAGNAITFTQAMTLDASGNLGVGMTTPSSSGVDTGVQRIVAQAPNSNTGAAFLAVADSVGRTIRIADQTKTYVGTFDITSSGVTFGSISNIPLIFNTNSAERARIDSSGNLLVATTSPFDSSRLCVVNDATHNGISSKDSGSLNGLYTGINSATTRVFFVNYNGNVTNTNNSYGAISDVKLKDNIVDATPKLADLMQVKVRNYSLKTDPAHKQLGVIAQELETVFPAMVEETIDKDEKGNNLGTTTKSVKYSVFVPMLIKAMQEQQALIESLTTRLAALESKLG